MRETGQLGDVHAGRLDREPSAPRVEFNGSLVVVRQERVLAAGGT